MTDLRSTFAINGHPLHPLLVPIPIALFVCALASDIAFVADGSDGWAEASRWLLGGGLAGAALAATAGFIDFAGNARIREFRDAWLHLFANLTVVLVEGVNLILRLPDPAVAGSIGIVLSGAAALILLFSGWKGGELVFRHGVGQIRRD
ncbi:MAG TPA: DUF2231 domain-containing protein [Croceibacterium sp.]|nr:DUF2231 domain-containing protein [Croceibacterium sp.]